VRADLGRAAAGEPVAPLLLEGVTGSGKTEIYLRAVAETLRLGRQAIVLVPEIALTPQTVRRFAARFPGQVGLIHSRLSDGERYDTWRRARAGLLPVIVGPRSALFAPLARLGLIVVDESHDDSYYQSDPPPRYHGRETAVALARLAGAVCLMGTATPDVVSAQRVLEGSYTDLRLPARILAHRAAVARHRQALGERVRFQPLEAEADAQGLPPIHLVDMRRELIEGSRGLLSRRLQVALGETLAHGEQAILLLNRLGAATYVFCRACGASVKCPRCDLPLTYHQASQAAEGAPPPGGLRCHRCGYRRQIVRVCPACGSDQIRHMGAGVERVEAEVQALFPSAQTLRWDTTTTAGKDAHEVILANFAAGRANVLVGTQMVAKGLDLPLVTLVGVVLAEVGLNLPDYRAAERTFQLLVQVAGRAGRSPLGGQVVMQTFQPEHYAIQAAARHDQAGFLRQELAYRRELGYPPFTQLVRLEMRHREARRAQADAEKLAGWLRRRIQVEGRSATSLIGPAPCFFGRVGGFYRWQVVIRGPDPVALLAGRNWADWRVEVNPPSLL
jgi:primosomal protein N' (replication factor Y)